MCLNYSFSFSENHFHVKFLVADAPERAFLRQQINHNGYFACDWCTLQGRAPHWPLIVDGVVQQGAVRTLSLLKDIIDNFEELPASAR